MPSVNAIRLFKRQRVPIACAVARQIQRTVPAYRSVDGMTLARNVDNVLDAVSQLLDGAKPETVLGVIEVLRRRRLQQGMKDSDFLVAVLCTLPVIRRFCVQNSHSVEQGLAYYEEIEALLLPLYGLVADSNLQDFEEAATIPAGPPPGASGPLHSDGGTVIEYGIASVDEPETTAMVDPYLKRYPD